MFHHGLLATQTELLYVTGPYTELGIAIVGLAVIWIIVHWAVTAQVLCLPVPILVTLAAINDWSNIVPKRRKAWSDLKQSAIESLRANTTACKAFPINSLTLVDYDEAKKTLVVQAGKLRCNLTIRPSNADQCKAFVAHCKSLAGLPG